MVLEQKIVDALYGAIDELNEQLPEEKKIAKNLEAVLATLDSLATVNLIVLVEQKVEERLEKSIVLVDEKSMSEVDVHPFQTVGSLVRYIATLVS